MATVSVIIPTYNRATMVKEAVSSVLNQTYTDYEIILVDDGSSDDTRQVVTGLSPKIKYLYQENRGPASARNLGISASQGKYLAFLDSDDMFLPAKLQTQVDALDRHPRVGMVYTNVVALGANGREVYRRTGHLSGRVYPDLLFIRGTIITTPSVMVRADAIRQTGGFDESMWICEDLDLWRRIAMRCEVLQIEQPLVVVRYRPDAEVPFEEYARARSLYYEKAVRDDPALDGSFKRRLFREMYCAYALAAIGKGKPATAWRMIRRCEEVDRAATPFVFVGYLAIYAWRSTLFAAYRLFRFLLGRGVVTGSRKIEGKESEQT